MVSNDNAKAVIMVIGPFRSHGGVDQWTSLMVRTTLGWHHQDFAQVCSI